MQEGRLEMPEPLALPAARALRAWLALALCRARARGQAWLWEQPQEPQALLVVRAVRACR